MPQMQPRAKTPAVSRVTRPARVLDLSEADREALRRALRAGQAAQDHNADPVPAAAPFLADLSEAGAQTLRRAHIADVVATGLALLSPTERKLAALALALSQAAQRSAHDFARQIVAALDSEPRP